MIGTTARSRSPRSAARRAVCWSGVSPCTFCTPMSTPASPCKPLSCFSACSRASLTESSSRARKRASCASCAFSFTNQITFSNIADPGCTAGKGCWVRQNTVSWISASHCSFAAARSLSSLPVLIESDSPHMDGSEFRFPTSLLFCPVIVSSVSSSSLHDS